MSPSTPATWLGPAPGHPSHPIPPVLDPPAPAADPQPPAPLPDPLHPTDLPIVEPPVGDRAGAPQMRWCM